MNNLIKTLRADLTHRFKDNLYGLLLYGSSVLNPSMATDLDILVILKQKLDVCADLECLREIMLGVHFGQIDMQLIYQDEIVSPELFSLDAHGSYFSEILKRSKVLYGENPFIKMPSPSNMNLSVLCQVQNYIFRARQEAMGLIYGYKDRSPIYHKKKIKNIMNDIMLAYGGQFYPRFNDAVRHFQQKFSLFSPDELNKISKSSSNCVLDYIKAYEKLYSFLLESVKKWESDSSPVLRASIDGIVSEVCFSNDGLDKALILLDGIPSVPKKRELMKKLAGMGYTTLFPRYLGTWESEGVFLRQSPLLSIEKFIEVLTTKGIEAGKRSYVARSVYILSTSFGGAIALRVKNPNVIRAAHLSPVTDFQLIKEELRTLPGFISRVYSCAYRSSQEYWQNLFDGTILGNSERHTSRKSRDLVIGGDQDKTIDIRWLKKYCKTKNLKLIRQAGSGHLNFEDVEKNPEIFWKIIHHFE